VQGIRLSATGGQLRIHDKLDRSFVLWADEAPSEIDVGCCEAPGEL